ncbi:GNAT family N-acetyltransferase [Chitinimonas sp.]|uniref:GNAT family N-acetyltransferase n=1 Tax=Chitinimonas sp. TaxID=1934313 RepID=UPI0035B34278
MPFELRGERVILRDWRDSDLPAWVAMNADPKVRQHFMSTASEEQASGEMRRLQAHAAEHGFTFWALEIPGLTPFAGAVGMIRTPFEAHFTPCVEIGWRLATDWHGKGYAREAAELALQYGFEQLGFDEVVALTVPVNTSSWGLMERLGMRRDPADDFDHPRVPEGHPLRRHVLYRLKKDWR